MGFWTPAVTPALDLNFFPARYSARRARVWVGPWESSERAEEIAAATPGEVTWRDPDDGSRLLVWHPDQVLPNPDPAFKEVTFSIEEHPKLFERLTMDAVRRRFLALGFEAKKNGFVNYSKNLASIPALVAVADEPIGIFSKIIPDIFFTRTGADAFAIGLVLDVLYTTRLEVTAEEWIAAGLKDELRGRYVLLRAGSTDATWFPDYVGQTIGKVAAVGTTTCTLSDRRNPELEEVSLDSIYPEPNRPNLLCYLEARCKREFARGQRELAERLRTLVRPGKRYRNINAAVERLHKLSEGAPPQDLAVLPGLSVRFENALTTSANGFPCRRLVGPVFCFDQSDPDKTTQRIDEGLRRFGPYDRARHEHAPFRILVVAPENLRGEVGPIIHKLRGGIRSQQQVFTGLEKMYRLEQLDVTIEYAKVEPGNPTLGYLNAIQQATSRSQTGDPSFHLALVIIYDSYRSLPDSENPYFQTKGLLLALEGIPTQAVTIEKLRGPDYNLQYTLNTLAHACYAKMGGTSHVLQLPPDPDVPHELVFGVGRSITKENRFGEAVETIGFATVFRSDGQYLYNDCTPYCEASSYEEAFERTIRRAIQQTTAHEQIKPGSEIHLVFHVPRRSGRHEVQAILNAVGKVPRFNIKFALLHINEDHHFQLFDPQNLAPTDRRGQGRPDAAMLPERGLVVSIGPRERLLTFVGIDQYRGDGCPAPLRVTLDAHSTLTNLDYLVQQIYLLSFMSAGSLSPGTRPVTVRYAEDLADLTGHLRSVSNWSVALIYRKLGHRLWFI